MFKANFGREIAMIYEFPRSNIHCNTSQLAHLPKSHLDQKSVIIGSTLSLDTVAAETHSMDGLSFLLAQLSLATFLPLCSKLFDAWCTEDT